MTHQHPDIEVLEILPLGKGTKDVGCNGPWNELPQEG
jgi:hypothetical protein